MNKLKRACAAAALTAACFLGNAGPILAGECVTIIGTEPGVPNLTMDPAFMNTSDDSYQQFAVYNRLLDLDENMSPVPELAKSWSVSDDGRTWTFELEQGVKFHDGSDFDSGDVVFTFRRLIDPDLGSPARGVLGFLTAEGIQAAGPHTVTFTTDDPVADLPTILGVKYNLIVSEGSTAEGLRLQENGTGPFIQEVFTPTESRRVFRRNADYWRAGLPRAECLEISVITEEVTRTAAIKSGAADLLMSAGPASIPLLRSDPNVKLISAPPGTYFTLSMWTDVEPFNDVRVRQALKAVIDRQLLVDTVLLGFGTPGNDAPIPPTWPVAYRSDFKQQDIELAKRLLAEAGYGDGLTIELNTAEGGPGMVNFAQAFAQMAAQAGITIELVNNPADSYWDVIWMKKPFFTSSWSSRPPAEALGYTFTCGATYNEGRWCNEEYDGLLNAARSETDAGKRADLYRQAQAILSEEGGIIIPFFLADTAVLRAECDGYAPHMQVVNISYETLTCTGKEAAN